MDGKSPRTENTHDPSQQRPARRGDGGVYLVVADGTEEFEVALRYAARRAQTSRAHVGVLYVISIDDFQHWGNVEAMMRKELRAEAEHQIWNIARAVNDINSMLPVLYILEGSRTEAIVDIINGDENIRMLILGGGTGATGPGPLVQHFTGKGLGRLRVPVLVVPGHIEMHNIDSIAR